MSLFHVLVGEVAEVLPIVFEDAVSAGPIVIADDCTYGLVRLFGLSLRQSNGFATVNRT